MCIVIHAPRTGNRAPNVRSARAFVRAPGAESPPADDAAGRSTPAPTRGCGCGCTRCESPRPARALAPLLGPASRPVGGAAGRRGGRSAGRPVGGTARLYLRPLTRATRDRLRAMLFQDMILALDAYWAARGASSSSPTTWRWAPALSIPHVPAGDSARAVAGRLRAALAAPGGRTLRGEPQPAPALLPVPSGPEALTARRPSPLSWLARSPRHRSPRARRPLRRGQLAVSHPRSVGPRLGDLADGMEITQFTYFQQAGGIDCRR